MGQGCGSFPIFLTISFSSSSPLHYNPRKLFSASASIPYPCVRAHRGSESINISAYVYLCCQ